jgi:hypothetical protein
MLRYHTEQFCAAIVQDGNRLLVKRLVIRRFLLTVLSQIRIRDKKAIGLPCRSHAVSNKLLGQRYSPTAKVCRRLLVHWAGHLATAGIMQVTTKDWEPRQFR